MWEQMASQPTVLREILADEASARRLAAERLAGRRLIVAGTGTSYHAAQQGAFLLRCAGVDAQALEYVDADLYPPSLDGAAVILLSHRNTKQFGVRVRDRIRATNTPSILITGRDAGGDLETSPPETSAAFTASHTGALMRLAQLARALGADLELDAVPDAVAAELDGPSPGVVAPTRLLDFYGLGPNAWTAAEGALKIRETAYVAAQGLSAEQEYHGPKVALGSDDAVVALDGGGPGSARIAELTDSYARFGVRVHRFVRTALPEPLSIFPLTVVVQRIALDAAVELGANPDSFGRDRPGYDDAYGPVTL